MVECVRDPRRSGQETREAVQAILAPGETVRWSGRGSSAVTAGGRVFNACIGALFLGVGLWLLLTAWELREVDSGLLPAFFGAVFTILGPICAISPIAADRRAGRAWFAVTDARALIALDHGGAVVWSYRPHEIGPIRSESASAGRGHVWFAESYDPVFARGPYVARSRSDRTPITPFEVGFAGVDDPAGAERALLALKATAASRSEK